MTPSLEAPHLVQLLIMSVVLLTSSVVSRELELMDNILKISFSARYSDCGDALKQSP